MAWDIVLFVAFARMKKPLNGKKPIARKCENITNVIEQKTPKQFAREFALMLAHLDLK